MTYELIFEKYISEPEYEFDDCRRVARVTLSDEELSRALQEDSGLNTNDMPNDLRLLFALAKGMEDWPAGYHFCCFGVLKG